METVHQHCRALPGAITLIDEADGPVLRLSGEIDSSVVDAWQAAGRATDEPDDQAAVAVDVSAATFLDCRGLQLLVRATERARRSGRLPELRNPTRTVRRMVEIVGAGTLFATVG